MPKKRSDAEIKEMRRRSFERQERGKDLRSDFYNGTIGVLKGIFVPMMYATVWLLIFWGVAAAAFFGLRDDENKTKNTIATVLAGIFGTIGAIPFLGILIQAAFRSFGYASGHNLANYAFERFSM